jgi:benzil reductase ((S)-benzoin forming)
VKDKALILISGTTKGLGSFLKSIFVEYDVVGINRVTNNEHDLKFDLSEVDYDFPKILNLVKNYKKIVFISNASIIEPIDMVQNISEKDIENSIFINYINPAKIILKIIQSKKEYIILNLTSGAAFTSNAELSLYSSTKAAMHRFIEILKVEEQDNEKALLIDNFDPGRMQTSMQENLIKIKRLDNNIAELNRPEDIAKTIYELIRKFL